MQTDTPTTTTTIYTSAPVRAERKVFVLDLQRNRQGLVGRIRERTDAGRINTIMVPVDGLAGLRDAIGEALAVAGNG